ncbi:Cysteine-rich receptor-like protein kinase 10 [Linum perenne]
MAEIEKNKYGIGEGDEHDNTQLSFFSFKDVLTATDNFSESNKLGEGGFGPVYKGKLSGDQEVAMKRLSKKSGQGLEEFMNELKLIAKLQHTYLVRLLGCCVEREEKILIYEYMPNRSLDKFLFGSSDKAKLDWGQRVKIAEGVAQGLLYIHKYSRLKIIHRDMKASNVLLDAAMNPKISDFGMARIFGIDQDEANTNHIVGTYGYMSPEYAFYGQFSEKSDVFSFGVLLLEIVSGKRNKDFYHNEIPYSLLCWVWEIWKEGKPEELIDPIVKNSTCCNLTEAVKLIHVGLLCVQEAPIDRPTMSSVTQMLSSNDSQSFPTPGEPSFTTRRAAAAENSDQVPGGVFELGFFSPANSSNSYVGIWYHNISPRTVVWVANRNHPIPVTNLSSSELVVFNGSLTISVPYELIWVADGTTPLSTLSLTMEAVLQDDGNLVILDSNSSIDSSQLAWQSFDYPTDTFLPGQINTYSLISWNNDSDPSQGAYSLQLETDSYVNFYITFYNNVSRMYTIPRVKFRRSARSSDVYYDFNNSRGGRTHIVMNSKGTVQALSWDEGSKGWYLNWQEPRDLCQIFGYCGPFGSCNNESTPLCSCPTGFVPKSEKEWSLGDFSKGCLRKSRLGCNNDDMFIPGYVLPNGVELSFGAIGSGQQCELFCSVNCNCTAYSYQRNGCFIWYGDLYNLCTLRKDGYNQSVYIKIAGSEKPNNVAYEQKNPIYGRSSRKRVVIGAIIGSVVIGIMVSLMGLFLILRRNSRWEKAANMAGYDQNNTQLSFFSFKAVLAATDNFSESNKLGEGGFGPVYKVTSLTQSLVSKFAFFLSLAY